MAGILITLLLHKDIEGEPTWEANESETISIWIYLRMDPELVLMLFKDKTSISELMIKKWNYWNLLGILILRMLLHISLTYFFIVSFQEFYYS